MRIRPFISPARALLFIRLIHSGQDQSSRKSRVFLITTHKHPRKRKQWDLSPVTNSIFFYACLLPLPLNGASHPEAWTSIVSLSQSAPRQHPEICYLSSDHLPSNHTDACREAASLALSRLGFTAQRSYPRFLSPATASASHRYRSRSSNAHPNT